MCSVLVGRVLLLYCAYSCLQEDVTEMPRQHGGGDTLPQYYDEVVRMPNDSNGIVDWRSKLVVSQ